MIAWKKQGAAFVAELTLAQAVRANVIVVGEPRNDKGAVVMMPGQGGARDVAPLASVLEQLHPCAVIDILCMQERAFGQRGLPPPADGL